MQEAGIFRKEDSIALPVAVVLHLGVAALLVLQPVRDEVVQIPQRMSVSLATEVGLEATAPDPASESSAAIAPVLGEELAPDNTEAPTEAAPDTTPTPPPVNVTRSNTTTPTPPARDRSRPDRTRPKPSPSPARAAERGGGSRIGDDFLPGQGSSTTTTETRAPAATFGRRERASLASAITRQLRRHWTAPNGVDADKLVSTVSWKLNQNGSLRGSPTCRTDPGSITASNKPQAGLHCDRAIRAVRRAAPFKLPEQFYSRWDDLEWTFDRRL
ncbi:energy transducer TonB [Erythrobacter sp. WH158]|uniref:Energy transducer TonB n=1 Tax=Erythrobacter crassostreae TaxID=2828328 RepID=A0A9X1JJJ0_9SPHN|nr:energy transducer TonB [Erythrobacter crassostrea]